MISWSAPSGLSPNKAITYSTYRQSFKKAFDSIVPDITTFSTHSSRSGGATSAISSGASERNIQRHGRWGSPIVEVRKDNSMLYGETSDPMNDSNDPERADDQAKSSKTQPEVIEIRKRDSRDLLLFHLNINSIQNKFEELKSNIAEDLKAQVAFITETKIDATYPSSQFKIDGFNIFRNDRKKGGGGVMAFVSSSIPSKNLGLPCAYKTIEPLVIQSRIGSHVIFLDHPEEKNGTTFSKWNMS